MTTSRHSFPNQASKVRWLPGGAPAGPDMDGRLTAHKLLCLGSFDDDVQTSMLTLLDLQVTTRRNGKVVGEPLLESSSTWLHLGLMTDLQVGGGDHRRQERLRE